MATYTLPRVEIEQQFQSITAFAENPLAALVIGPQYKLFRYGTPEEKAYTSVVNPLDPVIPDTTTQGNNYIASEAVTYAWPNQPASSTVDQSYTKVFFENAKARYFPNADLGTSVPGTYDNFEAVPTVAGGSVYYPNRIKATSANTINLKAFGSTLCSEILGERGAKVGDIIEITGTQGSGASAGTLQATITALHPSYAAPTYGINSDTGSAFTDFYGKVNTTFGIGTQTWQTGVRVTTVGADISVTAGESYLAVLLSNGGLVATRGTGFTFDASGELLHFASAHGLSENEVVYFRIGAHTAPTTTWVGLASALLTWTPYWVHSAPSSTTLKIKRSPTATSPAVHFESAGAGAIDMYKGEVDALGTLDLTANAVSGITYDPAYTRARHLPASTSAVPYYQSAAAATVYDGHQTGGLLLTNTPALVAASVPAVLGHLTNWPTLGAGISAYTGDVDIVYTITVTRGGAFYTGSGGDETTCAKVRISSNKGDGNVTQQLVAANTAFAVGTKGLTAKFAAGAGLALGDSWALSLVAGGISAYNIVEVDTNLWGTSAYLLKSSAEVSVALYLKKDAIEIPQFQDVANTIPNWTQSTDGTGIEINSSYIDSPIYVTDALLPKSSTELAKLPVSRNYAASALGDLNETFTPAAGVYVQYRALVPDHTTSIGTITDITTIEADLGPVTPDNPLAQGVYHAKLNAGDAVPVYYLGLASNDTAGYNLALSYASQSNLVYGIVPLSGDMAIGALLAHHADDMSQRSKARWRVAWLAPTLQTSSTFLDTYVNSGATLDYTATITANPSTGYIELLSIVAGSSKRPLVGLRAGDVVQYNFSYNAQGTLVWEETTVTSTLTNTTCLVSVIDSAVSTATKIKIIRNMTADEKTEAFVSLVSAYDDRRVRFIFPNTFKYQGETLPSYYLAAACAGLRSGVVPHQPLTNYSVEGLDQNGGVSATYEEFTQANLDTIAETGCWIIAQDHINQKPYVRHQLTSNYSSGVYYREDSITTNVDSISYGLQRRLEKYIGKYNINPANIALITGEIEAELTYRATNTFTQSAGHQLISYKINSIGQNATFKDRIDAEIQLEVPTPLNNVNVVLII